MSNNCKPIFIVRVSLSTSYIVDNIRQQLDEKLNDYHVLVVSDTSISRFGENKCEFELFNPDPSLQDIDMKAIKKMINSIYKQNKK